MSALPQRVRLVEVGPRDGLQNEHATLSPSVRAELVHRLAGAGLRWIEAAAFVSPRWVPQMAGGGEVLAALNDLPEGVHTPVLVPNPQGLEAARRAGARDIAIFTAASESFCQRNTHCSLAESLARLDEVAAEARRQGLGLRGYVSCALGCPFEGDIPVSRVVEVAGALWDMGCQEISLGDTIGIGTPRAVQSVFEGVVSRVPLEYLAGHFHDTYGMAVANIYAALELGVSIFDSSVAGLGGCPYAPGASGNVATEDVLYLLDGLGIETGVRMAPLLEAGRFVCEALGREPASRVGRARWARGPLTPAPLPRGARGSSLPG